MIKLNYFIDAVETILPEYSMQELNIFKTNISVSELQLNLDGKTIDTGNQNSKTIIYFRLKLSSSLNIKLKR